MGRMLGAFDDSDELDRPDLNKCPDCGCFFAQEACPLCGKVCPEEMRAGNRKPVKKSRRRSSGGSGRVTFVEWYHSWWFMILMMFVFPLAGLVLFITSPYKRKTKTIAVVLAVIYLLLSHLGIGNMILSRVMNKFNEPVDTSLSREEYISVCESISAEEFYRSAEGYKGKFVSFTLTVEKKIADYEAYYNGEAYDSYYICRDKDGSEYEILVRDCIQDKAQNFIAGDVITVYGEGAGNVTIYDMEYVSHSAPCVYVAYVK